MKQVKWFDRKFNFPKEQNIFPAVLERLSGTPIRLEEKLKIITADLLTKKINNTWSIQENVGHLIDAEPLWQGRLLDIINGEPELRPVDLQNTKTDLANHNDKPVNQLLLEFRAIRSKTLMQLEKLDEHTVFKSSMHPRLKIPFTCMGLFLFVAEHDDHHLARITEIIKC